MRIQTRLVAVAAAVLMTVGAGRAMAQSPLATADAAAFLGAWTLGLDTPQGSMTMNLTLKDDGGKVVGTLTADMMPDAQQITDISKVDNGIVLAYTLDVQGQSIPAKIAIAPDGDKWTAAFDFADGQFMVDGTATKN